MQKRVLIIQNDPPETLGLYETYLRQKTHLTLIHAYTMKQGEEFPNVSDFDAFIIGPTPISANDVEHHEFLRKEWRYLQEIVDSGKPVLGVCCGGQMLSRLLGGEVKPSPMKEVGGYTAKLTKDGLKDPLFKGFPEEFPVFHWHSEMFTVPPGGTLLATGSPCPIQAYAKDNTRGIIFHLEITTGDAERWAAAYPKEPPVIQKTVHQVLQECREAEPEMRKLAEKLVDNLLNMTQ
ncbi:MAG: type 1 glutamine amidotransferase [Candidatus Bathyarchaeota archaeon]|nr:type 1 glutamine amidotransferase [Candidatus Bathyarchaeota archaeon]